MFRNVLVVLSLAALMTAASAETRTQQAAIDLIGFVERAESPSCPASRSVFAVNRSIDSRIVVTVKSESDYPVIYWYDSRKESVQYTSPRFFTVLLHPGEEKRVGCVGIHLGYQSSGATMYRYRFSKTGAYYPKPDQRLPDEGAPQDFVRFFHQQIKGFPTTVCPLPIVDPTTFENIVIINLNPVKTIAVTYQNNTPGRGTEQTKYLAPMSQQSIGCTNEWPNLVFKKFDFIG